MSIEPRIISVHSGKGGVGKTTLVANLGAKLAATGARTLLIDSDFFTRGMTFLLAQHEVSSELGYLELLGRLSTGSTEKASDTQPHTKEPESSFHKVRTNLYLLPPTHHRGSTIERKDADSDYLARVVMDSIESESSWQNAFRSYLGEFQFVIFDCRSGTDRPSIAPAFLSDEYWIVMEEDNTSIRASHFLLDAIEYYASDLGSSGKKPKFGGFIVNMTVSSRPDFIAESLQRILSGPCLAVAPLSRRAREAFIQDKLVVESHPADSLSREVFALAEVLRSRSKESATDRLRRQMKRDLIRRWSVVALVVITPVVAIMALGWTVAIREDVILDVILYEPSAMLVVVLVLWAFGLAGGAGLALYLARKL